MIEEHLRIFREQYPLTKVMDYTYYLVYKCPKPYVKSCIRDAEILIDKLGLNLTAKYNGRIFDSFIVKEKP